MMKGIATALVSFLIVFGAQAQIEFNHGTGASYIFVQGEFSETTPIGTFSDNYLRAYPGFSYYPRLDFAFANEMSIGLASAFTGAFNFFVTNSQGTGGFFAADLPVLAQFNVGYHSTRRSEAQVGGFFSAGWDFGLFSGLEDADPTHNNNWISGPMGQVGLKFVTNNMSLGFKFHYTVDVHRDKARVIGIGILYNFF